jgi:hypothetical protein
MTSLSCPYCFKPLSEAERDDRAKTVFWFGRHGKQFAHTRCWLDDEVAPHPVPEPVPALQIRKVKRVTLRKDH